MYIFKAGVVGAGFMGAEIAQVISYSGLPVVLKDVDQALLDKGLENIREIYQRRVDKGKMDRSLGSWRASVQKAPSSPPPPLPSPSRRWGPRPRSRIRSSGCTSSARPTS